MTVIDSSGFRANVGIIVANTQGKLLWAKRCGNQNAWQFPQGGIHDHETPLEAMYRELTEELGLTAADVTVIAETKNWLHYRLPVRFQRHDGLQKCIGQKQKWFLLQLISDDTAIKCDASDHPEFQDWRWVSYWFPLKEVIFFKRSVYRKALEEFLPLVPRVPLT
jgi:putative (di)nucleoside polyphosphate hydrolase